MADTNPWSAESWNLTAQMEYVRKHGVARAEARARDAGTQLGARRPAAALFADPRPAPWVSPRYIIINKIQQVGAQAQPTPLFLVPTIQEGVGFNAAVVVTFDSALTPVLPAIGFSTTSALTVEVHLAAAPALAASMSALFTLEQQLDAAPGLAVDMLATLIREFDFTATAGLAADMTAALTRELDIVIAPALAPDMFADISFEQQLTVAPALAADMLATITREFDFTVTANLAASMTATLTREADLVLSPAIAPDMQTTLTRELDLPSTTAAIAADMGVLLTPLSTIFVAISNTGTGNRVMTSPDGTNWTSQTSSVDNNWRGLCWANTLGLFVSTATSGVGNRVMTSPDGVNWTTRTSAADNNWFDVCWSSNLGLLVAVAASGTGNRVMTSPDGITWTSRTSAADNSWASICWSSPRGLFVAVGGSGVGNRVMTSPDGITWTLRTSAADNIWVGVCWSDALGLFVAVSNSGTGNRVMTSSDGITWTIRTTPADNTWVGVCWAASLGLFVAVAQSGVGNRVMTSPDGITWTLRTSAADNNWFHVIFSDILSLFVAVTNGPGTGNRVMTSLDGITWTSRAEAVANGWLSVACRSPVNPNLTAHPLLGASMAVTPTLMLPLPSTTSAVGVTTAASVELERQLAAVSDALGIGQATTLDASTLSVLASAALGIGQAVTLTGLNGVSTFVQVGSTTTSSTTTLAYPAGIAAGDVAIVYDYIQSLTGSFGTTPAGFVQVTKAFSSSNNGLQVLCRILDGTEGSSITLGPNTTMSRAMVVVRPDVAILGLSLIALANGGTVASAQGAATIAEVSNGAATPTIAAGGLGSKSGAALATWSNNNAISGTIGNMKFNFGNDDSTNGLADHLMQFSSAVSWPETAGFCASATSRAVPPTLSVNGSVSGTDFNRSSSATSLALTSFTPAAVDTHALVLLAYKSGAASTNVTATGVTFTRLYQITNTLNGASYTVELWSAPSWGNTAKTLTCSFGASNVDCIATVFTAAGGSTLSIPFDKWLGSSSIAGSGFLTKSLTHGTGSATANFANGMPDMLVVTTLQGSTGAVSPSGFTGVKALSNVGATWSINVSYKSATQYNFSNSYTITADATGDSVCVLSPLMGK